MDNRRVSRVVTDPVFRQVGFNPRGSEPLNPTASAPIPVTVNPNPNPNTANGPDSISPVMIPPRIADPSAKALPVPVPSPNAAAKKALIYDEPNFKPADSVFHIGGSPESSSHFSTTDRDNDSLISSEGPDLSRSYVSRVSSAMEGIALDDAALPKDSVETQDFSSVIVQDSLHTGTSIKKQQQPPRPQLQAAPPPPDVTENSKPLKERTTKAERRAKQEADRAAKQAARENAGMKPVEGEGATSRSGGGKSSKGQVPKVDTNSEKKPTLDRAVEKDRKKDVPPPRMQFDDEPRVAKARKRALIDQIEIKNRVELFRHLPQFVHGTQLPSLEAKFFSDDSTHPHPSVYQVGLQYLTGDIVGGNARCLAMLLAFREVIQDYCTPEEKSLVRDLTTRINSNVSFLITCRPLCISMGNAIRFLKTRIAKLTLNLTEEDCKSQLISDIDRFIQEKILIADKEITKHAVTKIKDGDVILTYASSSVVEMIILHAFELGLRFRVIVVDSRPKLEARMLLKRLLKRGISCSYTHINALSYIMQEATKVFLGASAILSNGTVYSRVGSACVAMVAHALHIPVLVCCETYKFHERVQLDSICSNELGDPDALVNVPGREDLNELQGWAQYPNLKLLNLTYDVMPAEYVSMIISELGMVPPTSVPVILREYRREPIM